MIGQDALLEMIQCQLPEGVGQKANREILLLESVEQPAALSAVPLPGTLRITNVEVTGVLEAGTDYRANYLSGTVTPLASIELPLPTQVLVSYASSMLATYLEMAIADLGTHLPQKRLATLNVRNGEVRVPVQVQTVLSLGAKAGGCGYLVSDGNCNKSRCGSCNFSIRNGCISVRSNCSTVDMCYMGGFVLDCNGCYDLTPRQADLVSYKAISLALCSPMTMAIASGSTDPFSMAGDSTNKPSGPIISRDQRIGDESVSIRWSDKSTKSTVDIYSGLSAKYEKMYLDGIETMKNGLFGVSSNTGRSDFYVCDNTGGSGSFIDSFSCI